MALRGAWMGALLLVPVALAQQGGSEQDPLDSGLIEETGQRLIQLDVSFSPKKKSAAESIPEQIPLQYLDGRKPLNSKSQPRARARR